MHNRNTLNTLLFNFYDENKLFAKINLKRQRDYFLAQYSISTMLISLNFLQLGAQSFYFLQFIVYSPLF